jgi:hypothetical protein
MDDKLDELTAQLLQTPHDQQAPVASVPVLAAIAAA